MKHVSAFLQTLVDRSHVLLGQASMHEPPTEFERDYVAWVESALQALGAAELTEYRQKVSAEHAEFWGNRLAVGRIAGLLQSAVECLEHGFVGRLKHALHAEMFGSLASQARALLRDGHRIPAAVLGRIALEDWLRDTAESLGVPNHQTEKASRLNDALKTAGKLNQPKWRLIQSHLDTGNAAAHGKDDGFADEDVTRMLDFIEANCLG